MFMNADGNCLSKSSKVGPKPSHGTIDDTITGVALPTSTSFSLLHVPSLHRSSPLLHIMYLLHPVSSETSWYDVLVILVFVFIWLCTSSTYLADSSARRYSIEAVLRLSAIHPHEFPLEDGNVG